MSTLLFVDPSPALDSNVRDPLDVAGFDVVHVRRCADVANAILSTRPALVFVDVFAPEMGGFVLVRTLSRDPATVDVPVVMMGPAPYAAHKVRALWSGAREFVVRPVDPDELLALVRTLVRVEQREVSPAY